VAIKRGVVIITTPPPPPPTPKTNLRSFHATQFVA